MDQGVGRKPMDRCHRTHPYVDICPRCSVRSQLILGLKKTAPVCINCAIDPTWTNPQENWGQGGVAMLQGQEFQGDIGPSRIIIQHPSYTVFEQLHGDKELVILNNHSMRAFLLPRRNGETSDIAKSQMPNVSPTQPQKLSVQSVGQLAERKKTSKSHQQVHLRSDQLKATKIPKQNKAKKIGGNQPCILKRDNYHSGNIGIAMGNSSIVNNVNLTKSRLVQNWKFHEFSGPQYEATTNARQADANQIGVGHHLLPPGLFCHVLTNNSQNNPVDFANNCCVQDCRTSWIPNQYISPIQAEAMTVYAPHVKPPVVRIGAEHTLPPEGAVNWQFRVTPENIQPIESANQSNHKLSRCYPNGTFCCELVKQDALPRLATSSELNRIPKCANDRSYSVERNDICQTGDAIPRSKPLDSRYQTHTFCSDNPITSYNPIQPPVIHKQVAPSHAIKRTCCMTTGEKQMDTETLANQNLENWHSKLSCSEFVNTQPLPQRAPPTEQVDPPNEPVDLTYKFATKEIHAQHDAAKPSNQDRGRLYPFSLNSDLVIAESLSTSAVQAKPLEEGSDMAYKMARQENCTQIEAEEPKQEVLWDRYPYSIFNLTCTKPLSTSIEQVKPPEKKIEKGNIMATQENRAQAEIAKASNHKVPSDQHPRLANSSNHVETQQHAPILTLKTEDELTQMNGEEPRKVTSMDTSPCLILPEFDSLEDLINDIKSRMFATPNMSSIYTAGSNMKKYMGSGNEDKPCKVHHYPKPSNPGFTLRDDTCPLKCPQNKETGIAADGTQTGPKLVQNDSSVTLREQVLNKEMVCHANKVNEKGIKPRIQKAVSKQLKRRLERQRNDVDCAESGGKRSVANEREVTEATQSKTLTESITQGGNDQIGPNMYRKRLTDSASSPAEAKEKNTGQNVQEDSGIVMDCTTECSRFQFQDFNCGEKFEEKLPTKNESNNKNETCDERENQATDAIHELGQDSPCQTDTMTIYKELSVQLIDIASCNRKETFEDALGKADNTCATTRCESSYASKIVDLLVKQHEDWRDWSLKIDSESGLLLRNGKSLISVESMPMHVDSNECVGNVHGGIHFNKTRCFSSSEDDTMSMKKGFKETFKGKTTEFDQFVAKKPRNRESKVKSQARNDKGKGLKSAECLKLSKDPKRLGTLQFIQMSSVSEDLPKSQYARKEKSIQGGFRQKRTISKQKRHTEMKRNLKKLKMDTCYVRKMYAIESKNSRHYNQDADDNLILKLISVEKSSKASSNKSRRAGMKAKQQVPIPDDQNKQWTHNYDKSKGGRSVPSVKTPPEPQSTLVRHPEDLPKSSNAKKVRKSIEEYLRRTMKSSKQESPPKRKPKKPAQMNAKELQSVERSANLSFNKGKHRTRAKESKGERSNDIDNRRTDRRTINQILFDLKSSRNASYRRKRYSNQRSKSTQNTIQMGKRSADVGYRKTNQPRLVDPNVYHANIEFTNPNYTAMCKHIEDSIKEDQAFQTVTLSLAIPQDAKRLGSDDHKCTKEPCTRTFQDSQSCKADRTIQPRPVDPNTYHSNVENTNTDCVEMCQRMDDLLKGDKLFKLPSEITQDFKSLDSQTFSKKACTITSQDQRRDLESDVIEADTTALPLGDLKRPSKPDCIMPRNASYGKEKHSEKLKSYRYQERRDDEGCNNVDRRKALSILEFEQDLKRLHRGKNGRPYPDYIAKSRGLERSANDGLHSGNKHERDPRNKRDDGNYTNDGQPCRQSHTQEARRGSSMSFRTFNDLRSKRDAEELLQNATRTIKERSTVTRQELPDLETTESGDPRTLASRPGESRNARTNDPSASKPNLATSSPKEAAPEGEPVKLAIKMTVFDINRQYISTKKNGSIYSWFGLWIKAKRKKSWRRQYAEEPIHEVQQIIFSTYCDAYSNLFFTEWGYVTQSMKRNSCPVLSFMHRNTLEVTVYEHAIGVWACVTELSESGEFQQEKCFIASVWHNNARGRPFRGDYEMQYALPNYHFCLDDV